MIGSRWEAGKFGFQGPRLPWRKLSQQRENRAKPRRPVSCRIGGGGGLKRTRLCLLPCSAGKIQGNRAESARNGLHQRLQQPDITGQFQRIPCLAEQGDLLAKKGIRITKQEIFARAGTHPTPPRLGSNYGQDLNLRPSGYEGGETVSRLVLIQ